MDHVGCVDRLAAHALEMYQIASSSTPHISVVDEASDAAVWQGGE